MAGSLKGIKGIPKYPDDKFSEGGLVAADRDRLSTPEVEAQAVGCKKYVLLEGGARSGRE